MNRSPPALHSPIVTPQEYKSLVAPRLSSIAAARQRSAAATAPTFMNTRSLLTCWFRPVPLGYSDSDVLMVKSAQDRQGEHTPYPLGVAPDRRVLV